MTETSISKEVSAFLFNTTNMRFTYCEKLSIMRVEEEGGCNYHEKTSVDSLCLLCYPAMCRLWILSMGAISYVNDAFRHLCRFASCCV